MIKSYLLFCLFFVVSIFCNAQTDDAIEKTKTGLFKTQTAYKKCGITMTNAQFMDLLKDDPNMSEYLKPLALNYMGDVLLSTTATLLILWPVTEIIGGSDNPNWNLAYIGAGCALISIPFKKGFEKNADKAMKFYNNGYQKVAVDFELNLNCNGLGLAMKF